MNQNAVRSITIVGGGSSGWMTALYLNRLYNHQQSHVAIRLIESKDVGILGVGEATVHSIRFFFAAMGLDESELLRETNATLKTGIMFNNWMQPVDGQIHQYYHPFEHQALGNILDISTSWLLRSRHLFERYDQGVSLSAHLMQENHCPKMPDSKPFEGITPYGYHLDASEMARFLRRKAVQAGVEHVEALVNEVKVEQGNVKAVVTDKGEFSSDLFIDCSGFKGLLIEALKQDNWQSFTDELPCDKAVAMQVAYKDGQTPRSYTTATALSNGWAWEIDLTSRRGSGYVYDSRYLDKAEAEHELREHLGSDVEVLKTLHLDMKVGCRKEFWVGNCIAIGLSGGFIEPLESTGLHLINIGAKLLSTHISSTQTAQATRDSYNRLMNGVYDDLKRFIVLHYCLTDRDDTEFWQNAQRSVDYCPLLKQQLQAWQHKTCEYMDLAGGYATTFTDENYRFILYGMGHYPDLHIPYDEASCDQIFQRLNFMSQRALQVTMSHQDFLESVQGAVQDISTPEQAV
ncbi:tryptophan halogenase family protein [Thalassotalea sp. PS06]|uniref:tryptophan halogenase family protein n=1 Tax=Thalassotalea sp. PS06 TaxID=2594005 RepID=UPI0011645C67|nr:tryptophan halogenase family protein [Thalassotalea sp. PS06]QDP01885.1 tryptophan 7-halogenase [Thalassotalea sp. PS06]